MQSATMGRKRRSRFRFSDVSVPQKKSKTLPSTSDGQIAGDLDAQESRRDLSRDANERIDDILLEREDDEISLNADCAEDSPDAEAGEISDELLDEPLDIQPCNVEDPVVPVDGHECNVEEEEVMDLTGILLATSTASRYVEDSPERARGLSLRITNWKVLWGLLVATGSKKLTRFQYQAMRIICDAFRRNGTLESWKAEEFKVEGWQIKQEAINSLPHFTTLSSTYKRILYDNLTVKRTDSLVDVDTRKAGARATSYTSDGNPQIPVRFVLPSEFARMDLATPAVFAEMRKTSASHQSICEKRSVDDIPVVAAREHFYGPARYVSLDYDNTMENSSRHAVAEVGDVVRISLIGLENLQQRVQNSFFCPASPAELQGKVSAVWTVHHFSRKNMPVSDALYDESSPERHKQLGKCLRFVSYRSPSDSVTVEVPDIPVEDRPETDAMEELHEQLSNSGRRSTKKKKHSPAMQQALDARRAALKERKRQTVLAWRNWVKPVIKPGDIVALLSPCDQERNYGEPQDEDCLLFVHRFWIENEERSRHVMYIPANKHVPVEISYRSLTDMEIRSFCLSVDTDGSKGPIAVRHSCMVFRHSGLRSVQKVRPVSSFGRLSNGEDYFIYRFILFWDGFEFTKGKSASGDGFYLHCLNLPIEARSSASAVRVISLTPPGVKSAEIFDLIQADIVQGITEGFLDVDANGTVRRIFLDIVGVLGDTPALNEVLDILGHTSTACCHLCRFARHSTTIIGSRYTDLGRDGRQSQCGRSLHVHRALRDCGAQKETCRLLGFKGPLSVGKLPIHRLSQSFEQVRDIIPKTDDGSRVVPGILDPYKCCFVAPDHLLTGHMRDCLNLAFRLLPSKMYRVSCEEAMLGFLHDCELPTQNRLFDHEKKTLYSMSMSELYGLSVVAEYAFIIGCDMARATQEHRCDISAKSRHEIALVGSCARLISSLWYDMDGRSNFRPIDTIQAQADDHIAMVRDACTMSDDDAARLSDRRLTAMEKKNLELEQSACLLAMKTLDKPNVHRLIELVRTTLSMVGHVSVVGELVLEKAHQSLKRAIRQSNNKLVHLQSMDEEIFNDWQGRLAMVARGALKGDERAVRFIFRLLSGGDSMDCHQHALTATQRDQVLQVLGPEFCIPSFLEMAGRTVISPRTGSQEELQLSWALGGHIRTLSGPSSDSDPLFLLVFSALKRALRRTPRGILEMADFVRATLPNGLSACSIKIGDIVQVECYHPSNVRAHIPFLLTRTSVGNLHFTKAEGQMFWAVVCVFRTSDFSRKPEVWAAVRPCHVVVAPPAPSSYELHYNEFEIGESISFVKVGIQVRKTGKLHNCKNLPCRFVPHRDKITHAYESPLSPGTRFFIKSKAEGYPPRRG